MKRILVIDDEQAVLESFERALEGLSYDLETATGCEAALQVVGEHSVDLVFLDLDMPEVDGVETLRRMRASGCDAPVYFATPFAETSMMRLRAAADEGLDFELMRKPLDAEQIGTAIDAMF